MARRSQATPPHPDLFEHSAGLLPRADAADLERPVCTCGAGKTMRAGVGASTGAKALGPITEHRFAEAFQDSALASAKVAAKLVGLDVDTLSAMADAGIIRAVRKGRLRSYTEHALRAYLLDGPDAPSHSSSDRRPSEKRRVRVPPFSKRRPAHR